VTEVVSPDSSIAEISRMAQALIAPSRVLKRGATADATLFAVLATPRKGVSKA